MPLLRRADLELRHYADYIPDSMGKIDTDLDGIIADFNGENSTTATELTTHKTSADHDSRYYTETELDTKFANAILDSETSTEKYQLGFQRLMNPMFHLPLQNSTAIRIGTGSLTYTDLVTGSNPTTHIDRYGNFTIVTTADQPKFHQHGLYLSGGFVGNFINHSDAFDNADWTKNNVTITANVATEPSGTYTDVDRIDTNESHSTTKYYLYQSVADNSYIYDNRPYTASVFAQKRNSDVIYIGITTDDGTVYGKFDLDAGTASVYQGTGTVRITEVVTGWYRCELTTKSPATCTVCGMSLCVGSPTDGSLEYVAGSAATDLLYIYGAQMEPYASASSYMIDGVSATWQPTLTIPKDNVPSDMQDGWTFVCDLYTDEYPASPITDRVIYYISDGSTTHSLAMADGRIVIDNINVWTLSTDTSDQKIPTGWKRIVHVRKPTTQEFYLNGHKFTSQSYSQHEIEGDMLLKHNLYGSISNIRLYDFAMTEDEARVA